MICSRQLAYRYPGAADIAFADVDVPQGGTLLLRGPSGAGKSTWLAMAASLLAPTAGELMVAGQVVGQPGAAASDAWRARTIGFLPQKLHLSAALTVSGNLALAQWAAGRPNADTQIDKALDALGVRALADRKPSQLSGGQAQRVALARAVLLAPKVMLADEPTASLDDEAADASLALLRSTAQACGATLVIATHDARATAFFKDDAGLQTLQIGRRPS
jgi:putative ABC transport system ATP-binding protein